MNIHKLLGRRLLVEPIPFKKQSDGGIVLPETSQTSDFKLFRVLARADKVQEEIKVGQRILCAFFHAGETPLDDGTNRSIISEDQIVVIY